MSGFADQVTIVSIIGQFHEHCSIKTSDCVSAAKKDMQCTSKLCTYLLAP